jgi:hypothetical protein
MAGFAAFQFKLGHANEMNVLADGRQVRGATMTGAGRRNAGLQPSEAMGRPNRKMKGSSQEQRAGQSFAGDTEGGATAAPTENSWEHTEGFTEFAP